MSSKYDATVDLSDRNNSHTLMIELVGSNRDVLDVGCANGFLGSVLKERGCTVVGVELDAADAEEAKAVLDDVIVGNVEELDLVETLGPGRFDVVIFGDVLEHLRDPLSPLRQARHLLKQGGCVVISIPNVAHGSVRLSLLRGEFPYRDLRLLDNTHLRFFTQKSAQRLLTENGFVVREVVGINAWPLGLPYRIVKTLAPGLMMASHGVLMMVTTWPSWRMLEAPQPVPVIVWPAGRVKTSVQPLMAVVPVSLMVRFATNPPGHTFIAYCTRQVGVVFRWIVRCAVTVPSAVPPLLRLTVASNPVAAHWLRVAAKVE